MLDDLQKKFNDLEAILTETLGYMDGLNPADLDNRMGEAWTPREVLFHLMQSEVGTLRYLQKKMQAEIESVPKAGFSEKLRSKLLLTALNSRSTKYPAPKGLDDMSAAPAYPEIKQQLLENRIVMQELLNQFDPKMAEKTYFKHPFAGRLNIGHTLDFLLAHFKRHAQQIRKRSKA